MAGFGTGSPLTFYCAKCRARLGWRRWRALRSGSDWEPTGEMRELRGRARTTGPPRSGPYQAQYRCYTCGHIGWSRHVDVLDRLEAHFRTTLRAPQPAKIGTQPWSVHVHPRDRGRVRAGQQITIRPAVPCSEWVRVQIDRMRGRYFFAELV